jgi:predicted dehydrogenase
MAKNTFMPMNASPLPSREDGQTRRSFIKKAAATAAAVSATGLLKTPVYGQSQAPSTGRVIGANDRVVIGYIGTGSRGLSHIRDMKTRASENNIAQAAVCDLYQKRLDQAQQVAGLSPSDAYRDHRKLLERPDIDAVLIAPIDTWHAQCAIDALQAGKHVYLEKPMSRYLKEAFDVYDTVKRTGKVFLLGSQGCADPKWHKAAEWIRAGKIGPLVWAQGSYCRNNFPKSEWTYPVEDEATPDSLDWNRWLGRVKKIPFSKEHFFSWHKFYAFNSGIIGNLLPHRFNPLMLATGNPEFPRRVCCTGTRKVSTDREITDTTHILAEFPGGLTIVVAGTTVNAQGLPETIRGLKGTIYFATSQNKCELTPERPFTDELDPESFSDALKVDDTTRLQKHFVECIRTGKKPFCDVELAIRSHTVLCLAEQSERQNLSLLFDDKTRTITTGDGKLVPALDYDSVVPTPEPIPMPAAVKG